VSERLIPISVINENTVDAFAAHLESFADTLSDHERTALQSLLTSVLDPWERMRLRDPSQILSPEETEILRALEAEENP